MLRLFLELAARRYPTLSVTFEDPDGLARFQEASDPISYFIQNGHLDIAQSLSVGQAMMAIWSDFFNFIYEALIALEKRKFVVAFSLLRKPIKENLLFLTMMLVDESGFFGKLASSPATHLGHPGLQDTHRRAYFSKAKEIIPFGEFVDPEWLHDLIFDIGNKDGLAPLFDKATHLVTNREQIRTEDLNLNFVFKNPHDNDVYDTTYKQLSYILLYSLLLEVELFKKADLDGEKVAQWYALTGLGAFSGLFGKKACPVRREMNRMLRPFLVCPHCKTQVRITKAGAARFFTSHKLSCRNCRHEHDFPLFWLLSKVDWSLEA